MLTYLLSGLFVLLVAPIVFAHMANSCATRRLIKARPGTTIDEIFARYFQHLDRTHFHRAWQGLSSALGIDPEKLFPQDIIGDFAKARHLPELFLEDVEMYLREHGIEPDQVDVNISVREFIEKLVQRWSDGT